MFDIGMADAGEGDVDDDVTRSRIAARDRHRLEPKTWTARAAGVDRNHAVAASRSARSSASNAGLSTLPV
jgi:hypothetical protein